MSQRNHGQFNQREAMPVRPSRAVVIAPHPDDECLGVGGTISLLTEQGVEVTVVTVSADQPPLYPVGVMESVEAEARRAHKVLNVSDSIFINLPSVELATLPIAEINGPIEDVIDKLRPQLVFAPFPDRHKDHKVVFDASMVATRPVGPGSDIQLVALYETISETYWNIPGVEPTFAPNWTIDISDHIETKISAYKEFSSQISEFPGPRSAEALRALAMFRGSQSSFAYGESFYFARSVVSPLAAMTSAPPRRRTEDAHA